MYYTDLPMRMTGGKFIIFLHIKFKNLEILQNQDNYQNVLSVYSMNKKLNDIIKLNKIYKIGKYKLYNAGSVLNLPISHLILLSWWNDYYIIFAEVPVSNTVKTFLQAQDSNYKKTLYYDTSKWYIRLGNTQLTALYYSIIMLRHMAMWLKL